PGVIFLDEDERWAAHLVRVGIESHRNRAYQVRFARSQGPDQRDDCTRKEGRSEVAAEGFRRWQIGDLKNTIHGAFWARIGRIYLFFLWSFFVFKRRNAWIKSSISPSNT